MGTFFWKHVSAKEYTVIAIMVVIFLIPVVVVMLCKLCSSIMGVCYEIKSQRRRQHPPSKRQRQKSIVSYGNQTDSGFSEKIQLIDETHSIGRRNTESSPPDSAIAAAATLIAVHRQSQRRGSDGGIQSYSPSDLGSLDGSRAADFDTTPGDMSPDDPISPPPETTTTEPFTFTQDTVEANGQEHTTTSPPLTPASPMHVSNRLPEPSRTYSEMLDEELNSCEVLPARDPIHWGQLAIDHRGAELVGGSDQATAILGQPQQRQTQQTSQDSAEGFRIISSSLSDNTRYEE